MQEFDYKRDEHGEIISYQGYQVIFGAMRAMPPPGASGKILFLKQTHSNVIRPAAWIRYECERFRLENDKEDFVPPEGDGIYSYSYEWILRVQTADCMPVAFIDARRGLTALIHAGWRGVATGILPQALCLFPKPQEVQVFIGPHIQKKSFFVHEDVFLSLKKSVKPQNSTESWSEPSAGGHYVSLSELARRQLVELGLPSKRLWVSSIDTYTDLNFFSYRRQKDQAGRNLSYLICPD